MPLNSPSHLGMPIKREVGEQAVQFGGFPKAALNKSSPYPPGLGSTVRVLPLYVGQHRLVQKEGESPFYRWHDWGSELKWTLLVASSKGLGTRFVLDNTIVASAPRWGLGASNSPPGVIPSIGCGPQRDLAALLREWLPVPPNASGTLELLGKFFEKSKKTKNKKHLMTGPHSRPNHILWAGDLSVILFISSQEGQDAVLVENYWAGENSRDSWSRWELDLHCWALGVNPPECLPGAGWEKGGSMG